MDAEKNKERRTSTVDEYVTYLSDNLGMLHFSCRQNNSIAQPKKTFEEFFFEDVRRKIKNAFVTATGDTTSNDQPLVQTEKVFSDISTKPICYVLETKTSSASVNFASTEIRESKFSVEDSEIMVDGGEPKIKENTSPHRTNESMENERGAGIEEKGINKIDVEQENRHSNSSVPEKYLCKISKEAKTTLLELSMKSEAEDHMDHCLINPYKNENEDHDDQDFRNSNGNFGGRSDVKAESLNLSPKLLNLSGYKAKRINIHLEPGKGCDLASSKNLVKLTATVHLVGVKTEEQLAVNGYQSQEMIIENDRFHVLVPMSGQHKKKEVKVSFVLQVNPAEKKSFPSCFVEDIDGIDFDSALTESIKEAVKGCVKPINYVNAKTKRSGQKDSLRDRMKSTASKKRSMRKVSVKTSGLGRVSQKISRSILVPVVHSTGHQRLIKTSTTSKINFFTRCITDNACQTLKRFIMKNLNSEKRTLQSTSNLATSAESVTQFVKLVTQTAWIGPTKCSINGIVFKPIPLSTYPRLNKLVARISTLLARKAALPWQYNSIIVNMCVDGSDSYEWTARSLDKTVFRPNRPISILCVGSCRRLIVSDERGRVRGVVVMTNGSLLHVRRKFVTRLSLSVDQEVGVVDSTLFLTFHRCRDGFGSENNPNITFGSRSDDS